MEEGEGGRGEDEAREGLEEKVEEGEGEGERMRLGRGWKRR